MNRPDLTARRHRRWGYHRAQITTRARAARWLGDVGFALLLPVKTIELPVLWVVGTRIDEPDQVVEGWGPDAVRVWGWKDELPRRGEAWYGTFLRGRKAFLAPDLLAALYPRTGEPDDFTGTALDGDARRIAEVILASGPTSLAVLREAVGLEGKRNTPAFTAAIKRLGGSLIVTHFGVDDDGPGWPSAVLELTARAFDVRTKEPAEARRPVAAERFLSAMLEATAAGCGRALGWSTDEARVALDQVISTGRAVRERRTYRIAPE